MVKMASLGRLSLSYKLAILVCMLLSLAVASDVSGRPFRLGKLPDEGANFGCATCHVTPGGPRNPFGHDYEKVAIKAGDKYTEELGQMDSDGDGFTNDEEFAAGTNPGDANSKPGSKVDTQEKQAVTIQPEDREPEHIKLVSFEIYLYITARYLALTGFILIFIQYVLSSKIRVIEKRVGLDKLFSIHKKVGVLGLILVLFHPTLLFIYNGLHGYSLLLKSIGTLTLLLLLIAAGAAILYAKLHLKYETWKNIHRAGYVIFPLAFVHSLFLGSDLYGWSPLKILWLVLACIYVVVIIYKIRNMIHVRRHPFQVADVVKETHDVTSLYFEGKHRDYKPGQFMIVQLIRNGKVSEPHPFTISSSPTRDRLSISVKSVGDFTSTIGDTKVSDSAYIDAPYGRFSFLNYDAQELVFIAGGIGITPFMSMIRYIYDRKLEKNVTLIWGNKTEEDIAFRDELEKIEAEMLSLKIVHIMSKQDDWPGEKGYVDAEKLKKHISDFQKSQFLICGPPVMMMSVVKALRSIGVPKKRIHYERFALR
jgi:predicted ferric reductase